MKTYEKQNHSVYAINSASIENEILMAIDDKVYFFNWWVCRFKKRILNQCLI